MKLQPGGYYFNGRGDLLGPMLEETRLGLFQDQHGCWYHVNGRQWNHHPDSTGNIVAVRPACNPQCEPHGCAECPLDVPSGVACREEKP